MTICTTSPIPGSTLPPCMSTITTLNKRLTSPQPTYFPFLRNGHSPLQMIFNGILWMPISLTSSIPTDTRCCQPSPLRWISIHSNYKRACYTRLYERKQTPKEAKLPTKTNLPLRWSHHGNLFKKQISISEPSTKKCFVCPR